MAGPPTHYIPPPPPPPPPGWGPGMGSKPTSGKAIASLVLGLVGLVGIFCYLPVLGSLVGVVLGILGIIETGREGPRGGRGLAIAGTIVSGAAIGVFVAFIGVIMFLGTQAEEEAQREAAVRLDTDQRLILERLKLYYDQNRQSLGPGGPILAKEPSTKTGARVNQAPQQNAGPAGESPRVTGTLELRHLVHEEELAYAHYGPGWELAITGNSSATLRAKDWSNQVIREIAIQDIGRNQHAQTIP